MARCCIGVKGELVRSDITDGQAGVPMYVEYQIVDFNTCKPVPEVYLDIWHGAYPSTVTHAILTPPMHLQPTPRASTLAL